MARLSPLVWLALATVYVVWGSTYLAIRVAVRTMPPLLSGGSRFLLAGGLLLGLLAWRRGRRAIRIGRAELLGSAIAATLLLVTGIGLVMVAERRLESAFAGVVVASVPLWIVLLRLANRERVAWRTLAGVAIGLAGVVLLLSPSGAHHPSLLAVVPMLGATLSWSVGSYYAKRLALPADPFVATAWEMTIGGALLLLLSVPFGEPWRLHPERISGASFAGWAYLVTVGSIVAFSAYVWLLRNAPISIVVTHQFVNPVVAVVLGALILGEHLGGLALVGTTIVIGSVAFVLADGSAGRRESASTPPLRRPGTAHRRP